jgi:hypothetical protein
MGVLVDGGIRGVDRYLDRGLRGLLLVSGGLLDQQLIR